MHKSKPMSQLGVKGENAFVNENYTLVGLSIRNCVEPASAESPTKKYCASKQEVTDFFVANPITRIMYTENYVSISNSTNPLAT